MECKTIHEALAGIRDGATLMVGGFGLVGIPENLIIGLRDLGTKDLTVISNNCGVDDWGLGLLLQNRQIKKMIASYVGENKEFERQYLSGELEVELVPQGTLAERCRAGGAGHSGLLHPGRRGHAHRRRTGDPCVRWAEYLLERALRADFSLVKAWRSRSSGEPAVPHDRPQLQPDDGGRRTSDHCRGGGGGGGRRDGSPSCAYAQHLRPALHLLRSPGKAGRTPHRAERRGA